MALVMTKLYPSAVKPGSTFGETGISPAASVHPSARLEPGADVAAVTAGEKTGQGIPKSVVTDGPVVTKANAAGMQWMEDHFLI